MERERLIDFHTHIYPDSIAQKAVDSVGSFYHIPMQGKGLLEDFQRGADRFDLRASVVHMVATIPRQVETVNKFGQELLSDRVFVFGSLHPQFEQNLAEIDRLRTLGFSGVKMHPDFQQFNIDDPALYPVYAHLEETGFPILMHMGDARYDFSRPHRLAKVLSDFPGLTVIAAHLGGYCRWEEVRRHLAGRRLYMDSSSCLWSLGIEGCRTLIEEHGIDKIFFGSDYPVISINAEMELFDRMGLDAASRSKILYENAARFLGIEL